MKGTYLKISNIKMPSAAVKADAAALFDMDGVLVDVTLSYRKAIQETVGFFTGEKVQLKEIQDFKEKGGYNNDWDLTGAIIKDRGRIVPREEVICKFQEYYLGCGGRKGFIENEEWLLSIEVLKRLASRYVLGIVTGRPRQEAFYVLRKFNVESFFEVVIAMEDYPSDKAKPDPYPIELALGKLGNPVAFYVGDSVDDMVAARRAHVRAIGCVPPGASADRLKGLLLKVGAEKVLDDINKIGDILL